jgi:hypothetical protein
MAQIINKLTQYSLVSFHYLAKSVVRTAERLTTIWEVKSWQVPTSLIVECTLKDLKESNNAIVATESVLR